MLCPDIQAKLKPVLIADLITTKLDQKFAPAGLMATAIIEVIKEQGVCLPYNLYEKGFTTSDVNKLWHMAYSLAVVEIKLFCEEFECFGPVKSLTSMKG